MCTETGCELPILAKGLCSKHYQRVWSHGDTTKRSRWDGHQTPMCRLGCQTRAHGNGLCPMHYRRMRLFGTTDAPIRNPRPPTDAHAILQGFINQGSESECHAWKGRLDKEGYPRRIKINGKAYRPQRLWFSITVRPLEKGEVIDHTCHKPGECLQGNQCQHRACMNELHMNPTDNASNVMRGDGPPASHARKALCHKGHQLITRANGKGRYCPTCKQLRRPTHGTDD